jgi:hypothetical protein
MTLLDIAESLIADVYVHPLRVKQLAGKIPTRSTKKPPEGSTNKPDEEGP